MLKFLGLGEFETQIDDRWDRGKVASNLPDRLL